MNSSQTLPSFDSPHNIGPAANEATLVDANGYNKQVLQDYIKHLQGLPPEYKVVGDLKDLEQKTKRFRMILADKAAWNLSMYNPSLNTRTKFSVEKSIAECISILQSYSHKRKNGIVQNWHDDHIEQPQALIVGLLITTLVNISKEKSVKDKQNYLELLVQYVSYLSTLDFLISGGEDGLISHLGLLIGSLTEAIKRLEIEANVRALPDAANAMYDTFETIMGCFQEFILSLVARSDYPRDFFNGQRKILEAFDDAKDIDDFLKNNPKLKEYIDFLKGNEEAFKIIKFFFGSYFKNKRSHIQQLASLELRGSLEGSKEDKSRKINSRMDTEIASSSSQTAISPSSDRVNSFSGNIDKFKKVRDFVLEQQKIVSEEKETYFVEVEKFLPHQLPFPAHEKTVTARKAYAKFLEFFCDCLIFWAKFINFDHHLYVFKNEVTTFGSGSPLELHNQFQAVILLSFEFSQKMSTLMSDYVKSYSSLLASKAEGVMRRSFSEALKLGLKIQKDVKDFRKHALRALGAIKPEHAARIMEETVRDTFLSAIDLAFYGYRGDFASASFVTGTIYTLFTAKNMIAKQNYAKSKVPTIAEQFTRSLDDSEYTAPQNKEKNLFIENKNDQPGYLEKKYLDKSFDKESTTNLPLMENKDEDKEVTDVTFEDFLKNSLPDRLVPKDFYDATGLANASPGVFTTKINNKFYRLDSRLAAFFRAGYLASQHPDQYVILNGTVPSDFVSAGTKTVLLKNPGSDPINLTVDNSIWSSESGIFGNRSRSKNVYLQYKKDLGSSSSSSSSSSFQK